MKKNLAFIMSLFMLLGIVAGCAQPAASAPSQDLSLIHISEPTRRS